MTCLLKKKSLWVSSRTGTRWWSSTRSIFTTFLPFWTVFNARNAGCSERCRRMGWALPWRFFWATQLPTKETKSWLYSTSSTRYQCQWRPTTQTERKWFLWVTKEQVRRSWTSMYWWRACCRVCMCGWDTRRSMSSPRRQCQLRRRSNDFDQLLCKIYCSYSRTYEDIILERRWVCMVM